MVEFHDRKVLHHAALDLFNLVEDVERYPEFLPYCASIMCSDQTCINSNPRVRYVKMTIKYARFEYAFTSEVTSDCEQLTIHSRAVDGPFKILESFWTFIPKQPTVTEVSFTLNYTFINPMLSYILNKVFSNIYGNFTQIFEQRADQILSGKKSL